MGSCSWLGSLLLRLRRRRRARRARRVRVRAKMRREGGRGGSAVFVHLLRLVPLHVLRRARARIRVLGLVLALQLDQPLAPLLVHAPERAHQTPVPSPRAKANTNLAVGAAARRNIVPTKRRKRRRNTRSASTRNPAVGLLHRLVRDRVLDPPITTLRQARATATPDKKQKKSTTPGWSARSANV